MENKYYPLEIGKDTVINLFEYPSFGIDGNNRRVFIKHLVKRHPRSILPSYSTGTVF